MTGKKETDIAWRQISVIVRADIFKKAHEQGIDISDICNKAIAGILGMDYRQHHVDDALVTRPVIIAQNAPPTEENIHTPGGHSVHLTCHNPVINADDPAASLTVRSVKRLPRSQPPHKERGDAIAPSHPNKEKGVLQQADNAAHERRTKKSTTGKIQKNDGLKKFVSTKITRSDTIDSVFSKDDMYQTFTRFCNEHKYAPVPDRKAFTLALKNKFAFFDKTINGVPSWVNVRLQ